MSNSQVNTYNFYTDYVWTADNFQDFQLQILNSIGNLGVAFGTQSILFGLEVTPITSTLNLSLSAGSCISSNNQISVVPATTPITGLVADSTYPTWSLLVIRPSTTPVTQIPDPTNPLAPPVYLQNMLVGTPTLIVGTPSATPSYPATNTGDVVVMGFQVAANATSFTWASYLSGTIFDSSVRNMPGRLPIPITSVAGNYQALANDRFIECSAASGSCAVTLPPVHSCPGHQITVLKSDSATGIVSVTPVSAETINGTTGSVPVLLIPNSSLTLISEANDWKIVAASPSANAYIQSNIQWSGTLTQTDSSGTVVDVTGSATSILTAGQAVQIFLNGGEIYAANNSSGPELVAAFYLYRGATFLNQFTMTLANLVNTAGNVWYLPSSVVNYIDTAVIGLPGNYTYSLKMIISQGSIVGITAAKLIVKTC